MNQAQQRALRIGASLIALATAVALGWAIAYWGVSLLPKDNDWFGKPPLGRFDVGVVLATVGIVLLVIKDLLFALLKIWSFIWSGQTPGPTLSDALIWLIEAAVAALILTVVLAGPSEPCPEDWKTCVTSADSLSPKCFLKCMRTREMDHLTLIKNQILNDHKAARLRSIASTPLLFPNARLGGETTLNKKSRGVALQPGHADQLRRFAKVLEDACPNPQNATLRVIGTSSKAPFRHKTPEESKGLNLALANLRAETARGKLCDVLAGVGLRNVAVVAHEWAEFDEIERSAFPGVDHLALRDPEHQARSVFVAVEDPAACFIESKPVKEESTCSKRSVWQPVPR